MIVFNLPALNTSNSIQASQYQMFQTEIIDELKKEEEFTKL